MHLDLTADHQRGQLPVLCLVEQVGNAAARELPNLGLALVEQVAREVETQRLLLEREPLTDRPGIGRQQVAVGTLHVIARHAMAGEEQHRDVVRAGRTAQPRQCLEHGRAHRDAHLDLLVDDTLGAVGHRG